MRILLLHQHYWPEIAATAQLLTDLGDDLARAGHEVTVICGQPSYRVLNGSPSRLAPRQTHAGVNIRRVPSYIPLERTMSRRLVHYGSFFASSLVDAVSSRRHDVALVMSSPPLLLGLSGAILRALRGMQPDLAIYEDPGELWEVLHLCWRSLHEIGAEAIAHGRLPRRDR